MRKGWKENKISGSIFREDDSIFKEDDRKKIEKMRSEERRALVGLEIRKKTDIG